MTNPTKAEVRRFDRLAREVGCLACHQHGRFSFADIHHIVEGGKRLGHSMVLPLCPWHHRGVKPLASMSVEFNTVTYGPSLAHSKRAFVQRYGTERELLEKANARLEKIEQNITGRAA